MGKLGKKARKFAKKNLQSVQRQKRKTNSMFKRKASKRNSQEIEEDKERDLIEQSNGRNTVGEENEDASLDAILTSGSQQTKCKENAASKWQAGCNYDGWAIVNGTPFSGWSEKLKMERKKNYLR